MSAAQYPYDPSARIEQLVGLDRLRAIEDRGLAQVMFDLWFRCAPDEVPSGEAYDPSTYGDEPDSNELFDPTSSLADERDRNSAAIHYCWKEFYQNMEDYERKHGKRLTHQQRSTHVYRFGGLMEKHYGSTYPLPSWVQRHKDWQTRVVPRGGVRGGSES